MTDYYTVEQISTLLSMHPKTVQRYIREGKLRATKIGKSWRVAGHDLSVFLEAETGSTPLAAETASQSVVASSVIDIAECGKEEAIRIMNTLTAVLNAKPLAYGQASMQAQYIQPKRVVRVTLWGELRFMAIMMETVEALTKPNQNRR